MTQWNKKTLVILNPVAGRGRGKKNIGTILDLLKKKIEKLELETSCYPGHISTIGQQAVAEGYRDFITIGGDGTPFELINGVYSTQESLSDIKLGMIPAGTGNSFLRDFVDISDLEQIINRILTGESRAIDVIEFSYHNPEPEKKYFINILGVGLIADILKLTNERLKVFGPLGYSLAVLIRLFRGLHNRLNLQVDGKCIEIKNSALVISNSKYTGGKMKIAPMARSDDGQVDMIVFNEVNRRDIITIFSNVFKGQHIHHKKVKVFKGKQIGINANPPQMVMADGELLGKTPLQIKVLSKKLSLVI
jgi:diacylglycerol kinase (ATP)